MLPPLLIRLWPWLCAILSGVLLTLCFAPWNQGWLCWIALTPLIAAILFSDGGKRRGLRHGMLGYVAGFVFFTSTFHWLSTALSKLYENPWLLALAPLVAMIFGCYYALWSWFLGTILVPDENARRFSTSLRNLGVAAAASCAWVMHEWVREWLFGGFGWNPLGVALHRDLAMIQIVDLTGVAGLTFLIAFCNLMAVIIVRRIIGELGSTFLKRVRWEFSFTVAFVALVFAYGVRTLMRGPERDTTPLQVVALQPNIPQTEKFDPEMEDAIFAKLGELTSLASLTQPAPQLVLWPEASTPRGMFADEVNYDFVMKQVASGEFGLLIGTIDGDPTLGEAYNTAALLTAGGKEQQLYRKMHLVPFGEYLPLRPLFAGFVGQLVPADFTAGTESAVFELGKPSVRLAPLICFEDTLGDLTRIFVKRGAQLLVNLTNDGWFLESPAAEQHLANALFRAVENRRPLVRCANTGVTCAVDTFGRVNRGSLGPFQQGFAAFSIDVPVTQSLTFYTRNGELVAYISTAVTVLILATWLIRRRRR
ncbi:MAG TPA: apolipoprotein N-acyltransferase [Chthoniobacteraceae bacterium]